MANRATLFLAFVLHRRDYGNTSLLLDIFASGQGRFPAIAKGARRPRNPASALLAALSATLACGQSGVARSKP